MAQRAKAASGGPGRPRSEAAQGAILKAARELVVARGYRAVTTEMIAAEAGAGKQTIYRWWPSKAALVVDALARYANAEIDPAGMRTDPGDLRGFLARMVAALDVAGKVLRSLMAEAQVDPAARALLRERLIEPRRRALRDVLARDRRYSVEAVDALVILIYGAVWYRLLLDEPLDEALIRQLVNAAERYRQPRREAGRTPEH